MWERNINRLPLSCALTGNLTGNLLLSGMMPNTLSHSCQDPFLHFVEIVTQLLELGCWVIFYSFCYFLSISNSAASIFVFPATLRHMEVPIQVWCPWCLSRKITFWVPFKLFCWEKFPPSIYILFIFSNLASSLFFISSTTICYFYLFVSLALVYLLHKYHSIS